MYTTMIRNTPVLSILAAGLLFFSACVPTSKFNASQMALSSARYDSAQLANKVKDLQTQLAQANQLAADRQRQIDSLNQQMDQAHTQINSLNQQTSDLKSKVDQLTTDAANRQALLSKSKQELIN